MSDSTFVAFDVLTKDNYNTWRMQAEALLEISYLWDYVNEDKELPSGDEASRESWMKKDKIAKSMLILHISSSLLPLVENCTTSREIWLKLANVYGNRGDEDEDSIENSDPDDEDAVINAIESSVDNLFEAINKSSEKKITEEKESLITSFTKFLFSQMKIKSVKKLPDEKIIVKTVGDFIDDIDKLSKTEIKKRTGELTGTLVDILLPIFDITPYENDGESKSDVDGAEIRDNDVTGGVKNEDNRDSNKLPAFPKENQRQRIFENKDSGIYSEVSRSEQQIDNWRISCELYDRRVHENSMNPSMNLYTPPPTPSPKRTYKCGVCYEEGHNRRMCPLNKPAPSASRFTAKAPETPKKSHKCGVCGGEGHNRTTCSLNKPAASASKNTAKVSETPKRSYKCGLCGLEGHNRTTCSLNKPAAPALKYTYEIPETPKKSYKCGVCGGEGHNRTTCSLNKPASSPLEYTLKISETPKRSFQTAAVSTPSKSYKCGLCGEEGHNRTTCSRNSVTSTTSTRAAYKCGICGGGGHNSRTCGRRGTASSSDYTAPSSSSSLFSAGSNSGGGRSYTCGNCGGSGHNQRTCQN